MQFMRAATVLSVFVCASTAHLAHAQATRAHRIGFQVDQSATPDGSLEYSLQVFHVILFGNNPSGQLIAPDGTEFEMRGQNEVHRSTFSEIASLLFGEWTAIAQLDGMEIEYGIRFAPFSLSNVFTDVPIITSPASGSQVPPQFVIEWEYKNGSMPSRRGVSMQLSNITSPPSVEFIQPGCCAAAIETALLGPGPGIIDLRVNTATTLSTPTLIGTSPLPGDSFRFTAEFRSQSAPVRYFVIPEPTSLSIGTAALVLTPCVRRRHRRSSSRRSGIA